MSLRSRFCTRLQVVGLTQSAYSAGTKRSTTTKWMNLFTHHRQQFSFTQWAFIFTHDALVCVKTSVPTHGQFHLWSLFFGSYPSSPDNCNQIFSASQLVFHLLFESKFSHRISSSFCHLSADNDCCLIFNSNRKIGPTGAAVPSLSTHVACIIQKYTAGLPFS